MTFDEQLQRALDTFSQRLQDEVTHHVRIVGDELAAVARAHEEMAAAARAQQAPPDRVDVTTRLAEGIRAMGEGRSLSEVLSTLVSCAAREAMRAGVLLVRDDRFQGWRFQGFDPPLNSGNPVDIARDDAGVVGDAVAHAGAASSGRDGAGGAPAFAELPPGAMSVAVPISIAGQVVAVLYADAGQNPGSSDAEQAVNAATLEILARFASQRLEALTAINAARSLTGQTNQSTAPGGPGVGVPSKHSAARTL